MKIDVIIRETDTYERIYLKLEEIETGYFCEGHVDKEEFLCEVYKIDPLILIDWSHWGWLGRWKVKGTTNDEYGSRRTNPTVQHVIHTYWTGRKTLKRGRPRGASSKRDRCGIFQQR